MTVCIITGVQCTCQPDEAMWCPDYHPDWYAKCLMDAIVELRERATNIVAWRVDGPFGYTSLHDDKRNAEIAASHVQGSVITELYE